MKSATLVRRGGQDLQEAEGTLPFYIYSITKSFLGVLALRLGMDLEAPLTSWLADFPFDRSITLRQALQHTSGIPEYSALKEYNDALKTRRAQAWTDDEFLQKTAAVSPPFAPGKGWAYSNTGYLCVRKAIEAASGSSLKESLARHIFQPFGLTNTWLVASIADAPVATITDETANYDPRWVGHGLIASTVRDVAQFYERAFALGHRELHQLVRVPAVHPPFVEPSYGFGMIADPAFPGGSCYGHGGHGPGYSLEALHWPAWKGAPMTIVVFYNDAKVEAFKELIKLMPS